MAEQARDFESFFLDEHRRLFAALGVVTGNRAEAEELMQDAFLKLWERWDRISEIEDPTAFLFRTAMNLFRNRYRRAKQALRAVAIPGPVPDAFAVVEDRDMLMRVLREVTPSERAAIVLTAFLGYSSEEAGSMLGMKAPTVRVLASRARASIRQTMEGEPT